MLCAYEQQVQNGHITRSNELRNSVSDLFFMVFVTQGRSICFHWQSGTKD